MQPLTSQIFIAVDKGGFRLHFYKKPALRTKYDLVRSFKVAIGQTAYETPEGLTQVTEKALNPTWEMPPSPWVDKALWGTKLGPDDPNNPLKVCFIKLGDLEGVGIHGTSNLDSLGHAASHGCIRMHPKSVLWVYQNTPVGTPVYIH